jgi:proline iminopeptidase
MDPKHMEWMADALPRGRFHSCRRGSHLAMYDDPETYFQGLIAFLKDVDSGRFPAEAPRRRGE